MRGFAMKPATLTNTGGVSSDLLTRLGLASVCCLGALFWILFTANLVSETRLFIDPKFDGFWDDVESFHLKRPTRKTPAELSRRYGMDPVLKYVVSPGLAAGYLPSERTVFISAQIYSLSDENKPNRLLLPVAWGFMLFAMYMPMVVAGRKAQEILSFLLCRHRGAREARRAYFAAVWRPKLGAIVAVFALTFALSVCDAFILRSPEWRQQGISIFELSGWFTVLSYFGGISMLLLLYIVDAGFLCLGINPHHLFWDDLITLAVMAPILHLVYQNSWLTVTSMMVTAFFAHLLLKWSARDRPARKGQHITLSKVRNSFFG